MSFDALPHDAWPSACAAIMQPWPEAFAAHDLRWHAAEHALTKSPLPSLRDLGDRWGWSKDRVARLIAAEPRWRDEARPWGWRATAARQPCDSSATVDQPETPVIDDKRDTSATAARQPCDSRAIHTDHPPPTTMGGDTRAREPGPVTPQPPEPGGYPMGNWRPPPDVPPPSPSAAPPPPSPPPVKPPPPTPPADDPDLLAYLGLGAQTWVLALGRRGIGTRSELLALTRRDLATMPGIAGGVAVIEREIRRHGDQLAEPPTEKARRRPRYDETPTGETLEEWAERKDREEAEAAARTTLRIVQ